jgi:hypothetical protein
MIEKKAYLGSSNIPVKKIAKNDRLKGIGCIGITICDITQIMAVNIPVKTNFLIVRPFAVDIIIFCLLM